MKKTILPLLILAMLFSCKEDAKKDILEKDNVVLDSLKIEKVAKKEQISYDKEKDFISSFYSDYISEIKGLEIDTNKVQSILSKYCSSELLQKIKSEKELDYDPFIDAQDVPPRFLQSLEISKVKGKKNRFVISYALGEAKNNVELDLVKKENQLKIDKVYTINVISAFDNTID